MIGMRLTARRLCAAAALLAMTIACMVMAQDRAAEAWSPPRVDRAQLDTLVRRNIFFADRRTLTVTPRPEPESTAPPTDAQPPAAEPPVEPADPDRALVLIGVTIENHAARAFIEDRSTGRIVRIDDGGPIGRGRITEITLAGVTYLVDGATRRIAPQQSLAGTTPGTAGASMSTPTSVGDTTGDAASSSNLSVLERMRLRRQQLSSGSSSTAATPCPVRPPPTLRRSIARPRLRPGGAPPRLS